MPEDPRLKWMLRRGMKELDVVFERYHANRYAHAAPALQQAFAKLLQVEDPVLLRWVMGQEAPPAEFQELVLELRRPA
jgi:antitoxin CptB